MLSAKIFIDLGRSLGARTEFPGFFRNLALLSTFTSSRRRKNVKNNHPCNKSPSAIAVTIVAAIAVAIAVPRAAAIAGVRAYESVPLYAVPL